MRSYLSIFRIRFLSGVQYRAVTLGILLSRFAWGFMEVAAYAALYRADPAALPMEFSQTVSYVWLQQTLIALFSVVFADGEISSGISDGSVAYELVRPMDLYGRWFCQSVASRVVFTALTCVPALLIALILPGPYALMPPRGAEAFLLFLLSTMLAVGVVAAFAMLMLVTMFYTLSHRGLRIIVTALTSFFSGGVVPLAFFPDALRAVAEVLPFAAMQNMPLRVYIGDIAGPDAVRGIVFQGVWLIVLVTLGRLAMREALKKVVVQGG